MRDTVRAAAGLAAVVVVLAVGCTAGSSDETSSPDRGLRVEALSTRAEYVTGGDVLVGVEATDGGAIDELTVTVDGRDVSASFVVEDGRHVGLIEGLPTGSATIEADAGGRSGSLEVVDHPTTGPLFSGPLLEPFVCKTESFGLGAPTDDDCSAPETRQTTDVGGVPTMVEKGVLGRSIYTIAFPQTGWNERLVYRFGGGCGTSYSQGVSLVDAADAALLREGYAVATSTLNTYQSVCNEVLSAEVALIVKEHFSETFGLPQLTIGEGGSGGAIQQIQIAQNYPGILDGLAPAVPFADAITTAQTVTDCGLLLDFFASPAGAAFDAEQQRAVSGLRSFDTCRLWARSFLPNIDPSRGCDPAIPPSEIFDPVTNRSGVRCTLQDSAVNLYGVDPTTGSAARVLDNTGVVYGRSAYDDGLISFEQLVELNAGIGGYDVDGRVQDERMAVPDEWADRVYATGRVTSGGGLVDVPIILTNVYTDALGDIHDRQRAFAIRDRLAATPGADGRNVVIWTRPGSGSLTQTLGGAVGDPASAVVALDRWLTAARADGGGGTAAERLARNRPADVTDRCATPDGEVLAGDDVYAGDNACTQAYPIAADPRRVAGAPSSGDVVRCRKRPLEASYFERPTTGEQVAVLSPLFPDGVCDWSQPGVGQVPLAGTWLTFSREDVAPG